MRLKTEGKPALIAGLRPETLFAMIVANEVCAERGIVFLITSCTDGAHRPGSLHYAGLAFDMRSIEIPAEWRDGFLHDLRTRLGAEFDVVYEASPPHIHVEFQPKKGVNL